MNDPDNKLFKAELEALYQKHGIKAAVSFYKTKNGNRRKNCWVGTEPIDLLEAKEVEKVCLLGLRVAQPHLEVKLESFKTLPKSVQDQIVEALKSGADVHIMEIEADSPEDFQAKVEILKKTTGTVDASDGMLCDCPRCKAERMKDVETSKEAHPHQGSTVFQRGPDKPI